ncbi:MAG TPA: hypothetical protein VF139_09410 [Candidatus Polarisedimenticolaceae bacterium]
MSGFETLTHARIRAAQGDLTGARRIARAILDRDPEDSAARELLTTLGSHGDAPSREADEPVPDAPTTAAADDLRESFRARLGLAPALGPRERLTAWLERVRANRSGNA